MCSDPGSKVPSRSRNRRSWKRERERDGEKEDQSMADGENEASPNLHHSLDRIVEDQSEILVFLRIKTRECFSRIEDPMTELIISISNLLVS